MADGPYLGLALGVCCAWCVIGTAVQAFLLIPCPEDKEQENTFCKILRSVIGCVTCIVCMYTIYTAYNTGKFFNFQLTKQ